jgi:hypothetical protein
MLCAGLLLPGIGKLREAARQTQCLGRLKQLGLAHHNYVSAPPPIHIEQGRGYFPPGTVPNPDLPPERRLSWYVLILPYVEQEDMYRRFDLTAAADDERNLSAAGAKIVQFVCPESGLHRGGGEWEPGPPVAHYVAVAGVGADAATLPTGHPRAGIFGYDRQTTLSMPDGSSNTLLLVETSQNPGHWAAGGPTTVRPLDPATVPYIGAGRPFGGLHVHERPWFSADRYGCNVGMADGSVRYVADTVTPAVLEALATVGGKEELPAE